VINVAHSIATHSHVEFNTNDKREEIFLENIKRINSMFHCPKSCTH